MTVYIGIDLGLRSNGIVALDKHGKLIDMDLITTSKSLPKNSRKTHNVYNDESMMIYTYRRFEKFFQTLNSTEYVVAIERLSYASISSSKDVLAGMHWYIRTRLYENFDIEFEVLSPAKWRNGIISKQDEIDIQLDYLSEDINKVGPYVICPYKSEIDVFVEDFSEKNACKSDAHYDLSDAYWIAKYLLKNAK